ncbi:MAG TPA: hypothetical protein VFS29_07550 [Motilibacteraceae bacterium]|nr:hypothetical protein [Motilibacteraceae bacterium]
MHRDGRRRPWGGALARVEAHAVLAARRAGRDLVVEFPEWFEDLLPPVPVGQVVTHLTRHVPAAGVPERWPLRVPVQVLEIDGARVLVRSAGDPLARRRWVWRRELVLDDLPALAAARAARAEDLLAAAAVVVASGTPVDLPAAPHAPVTATVDLRQGSPVTGTEPAPRRRAARRGPTLDRLVTSGG